MGFVERSYSGQLFRPRPEIHIENDQSLLIVATPWGPRSAAKKAIQVIQDYFHSAKEDAEATSPFAKISCLSQAGNHLRIALRLANDSLFIEDNKNEYLSGVELFALAKTTQETVWSQIGFPFPLLDRPEKLLLPLGNHLDLPLEFTHSANPLPPLPKQLLGTESTSNFAIQSFRPAKNDRLVLISRSGVPGEAQLLTHKERNLDNISRILSNDNSQLPYWLGIFDLA